MMRTVIFSAFRLLVAAGSTVFSLSISAQDIQPTLNAANPAITPVPAEKKKETARRQDVKPTPATSAVILPNQIQSVREIERAVFNRAPIKVMLRPGQERMLHFPNAITLHAPSDLNTLVHPLDIIDKTIYLAAQMPFSKRRVVAEDLTTGRMIPLDLEAEKEAQVTANALEIVIPTESKTPAFSADENPDEAQHTSVDMVALTRHAAQILYAPRRLIPQSPGIRQVRISTRSVNGLYRGAPLVETAPIGAWRSQDLYVTAVKFVNRGRSPVDINLDDLRGYWIAATAQHGRLLASGRDEDTTVVYLVSERPFEESR